MLSAKCQTPNESVIATINANIDAILFFWHPLICARCCPNSNSAQYLPKCVWQYQNGNSAWLWLAVPYCLINYKLS